MAHFDKHSTSIKALVDVSEAMLNAMEQHGNELTERIRDVAFQMDLDQKIDKKLN